MDTNQNLHWRLQTSDFSPQMPVIERNPLAIAAKLSVPTKATRRIKSALHFVPQMFRLLEFTHRGEIACAECWRLKVHCNRTIPCSKQGSSALCLNGILIQSLESFSIFWPSYIFRNYSPRGRKSVCIYLFLPGPDSECLECLKICSRCHWPPSP